MVIFEKLWQLIVFKLTDFFDSNIFDAQFQSENLALIFGVVLTASVLFKLFTKRKRFFQSHSGFRVGVHEEKWYEKAIYVLPKLILTVGLFYALVTLANPILTSFRKEKKIVVVRERYDLVDVSGSMNDKFGSEGKTKGQVAREAFLKFLRLRIGQNDRACFWIFSDNPYKIQDCIADDYVYRFQVFSAPLVLGADQGPSVLNIPGEGGTQLQPALRAILNYIDKRGDPVVKHRVLLIVTDALITVYPDKEFEDLAKRGVTPYMLWIKVQNVSYNEEGNPEETGMVSSEMAKLFSGISNYGGKVYEVGEEEVLEKAFRNINALERSEIKVTEYQVNFYLFQKPLFFSFCLIVIALFLGVFIEILFGPRIS